MKFISNPDTVAFFDLLKRNDYSAIVKYLEDDKKPINILDKEMTEPLLHLILKKISIQAENQNQTQSTIQEENNSENENILSNYLYYYNLILERLKKFSPKDKTDYLNIQNYDGNTVLMIAAAINNVKFNIFVDLLLNGSDILITDNYYRNAVYFLAVNKKINMNILFQEIQQQQINFNLFLNKFLQAVQKPDRTGNTPIHRAFDLKNFDTGLFFLNLLQKNNFSTEILYQENKIKESPLTYINRENRVNEILPFLNKNDQNFFQGIIEKELIKPRKNINQNNQNNISILIPFGHGNEILYNREQIPNDKVLLSLASCGIATKVGENGFLQMVDYLSQNRPDIFKKPIQNKDRIKDILQIPTPLLDYSNEYLYPNLRFTLLSYWNYNDNNMYGFSGIIPIELMKYIPLSPKKSEYLFKVLHKDITYDFFQNFIPSLFKFSVYPLVEEVKAYFNPIDRFKINIIRDLPFIFPREVQYSLSDYEDDLTLFDIEKYYSLIAKNLNKIPLFIIKLKDLYNSNQQDPMIVYNLICRGTYLDEQEMNTQTTYRRLNSGERQQIVSKKTEEERTIDSFLAI